MKLLFILIAASIITFPVTFVDPIAAAWVFIITLFFGLSIFTMWGKWFYTLREVSYG